MIYYICSENNGLDVCMTRLNYTVIKFNTYTELINLEAQRYYLRHHVHISIY